MLWQDLICVCGQLPEEVMNTGWAMAIETAWLRFDAKTIPGTCNCCYIQCVPWDR